MKKLCWEGIFQMKNYLACTHIDVAPCQTVPNNVKCFFFDKLQQRNDDEVLFQDVVMTSERGSNKVKKESLNFFCPEKDPIWHSEC